MANTTGGRITLTINGQTFSTRGKGTVMTSGVELKVDANNDGTVFRTVKAVPVGFKVEFDRGLNVGWTDAMMLAAVAASYQEDDAGVTHVFANASFNGKPELDTETGAVSGLEILTDSNSYQQLQA